MKQVFFIGLFLFSSVAFTQNWGIGVRLGDPSGLTLKKYSGKSATEFNLGRTRWLAGDKWYDEHFDEWYKDQKLNYIDVVNYESHSTIPLGLQIHKLYRNSIDEIGDADTEGLEWYIGFGAQMRFQQYSYTYYYKTTPTTPWQEAKSKVYNNVDLGFDGVIGLEYKFRKVPFSVFLDLTLFMEVYDDPFLFWFQSGIGGRYHF